jgi:hypothetical protein
MNIAKNMEAIFVATIAIVCTATFMTATPPVAASASTEVTSHLASAMTVQAPNVAPVQADIQAVTQVVTQVVTITGKRLSAAEKAATTTL